MTADCQLSIIFRGGEGLCKSSKFYTFFRRKNSETFVMGLTGFLPSTAKKHGHKVLLAFALFCWPVSRNFRILIRPQNQL